MFLENTPYSARENIHTWENHPYTPAEMRKKQSSKRLDLLCFAAPRGKKSRGVPNLPGVHLQNARAMRCKTRQVCISKTAWMYGCSMYFQVCISINHRKKRKSTYAPGNQVCTKNAPINPNTQNTLTWHNSDKIDFSPCHASKSGLCTPCLGGPLSHHAAKTSVGVDGCMGARCKICVLFVPPV